MDFAKALVWLMSFECFAASIAYTMKGNLKLAVYWICLCIVNGIVATF